MYGPSQSSRFLLLYVTVPERFVPVTPGRAAV